MVLESTIVNNFRKEIHRLNGRCIKTHGGNLMSLEPDVIGCINGHLFAAEAKKDSHNKPTRGQEYCLQEWKAAGAITLVFWNWKNAVQYIVDQVQIRDEFVLEHGRVYEGVIPY